MSRGCAGCAGCGEGGPIRGSCSCPCFTAWDGRRSWSSGTQKKNTSLRHGAYAVKGKSRKGKNFPGQDAAAFQKARGRKKYIGKNFVIFQEITVIFSLSVELPLENNNLSLLAALSLQSAKTGLHSVPQRHGRCTIHRFNSSRLAETDKSKRKHLFYFFFAPDTKPGPRRRHDGGGAGVPKAEGRQVDSLKRERIKINIEGTPHDFSAPSRTVTAVPVKSNCRDVMTCALSCGMRKCLTDIQLGHYYVHFFIFTGGQALKKDYDKIVVPLKPNRGGERNIDDARRKQWRGMTPPAFHPWLISNF